MSEATSGSADAPVREGGTGAAAPDMTLFDTEPDRFPPADALPLGELARRMGIVITESTPQRMVATMPVAGNRQPFGLLHGGASAVLAESVGSIHATLLAGRGRFAVGVELSCTHHRPALAGIVTAVCTPLHVGRSVSTFHIALSDEAGQPTCTARLTCMSRSAAATPPAPVAAS